MYISEEEWDSNIINIKNDINKLSDLQILMKLSSLILSIRDMHTYINPLYVVNPLNEELSYSNMQVFPIMYEWIEDDLRVISCDAKYEDILGSKLLSINNSKLEDIISRISKMYPAENNQGTKYQVKEYIALYESLKFLKIVNNEVSNFIFEKNNGEKVSIDIKTKSISNIDFVSFESNVDNNVKKAPTDSNKEYWFKYIEKDGILYFQYNNCVNKTSSWVPDENSRSNYPDFYAFVDSLVSAINHYPFDKFIIDLSNNPGGTMGLTNYMISKIESETNLNTKAKTYVISGGNTLSAGVWSIVDIVNHFNATVVGEETGSNVNTTSVTYNNFELPNSKVKINCGSRFITKIPGYKGGYKPDIEIKQNFTNYINGIYDAYEYIKNDNLQL